MRSPRFGVDIGPSLGMMRLMKLSAYMTDKKLTPEEMAEKIGNVSASGVIKWAREERVPRKDQMQRIYEATNGMVTPNDFVLQVA